VGHTPTRCEDDLFEWQLTGRGLHVVATRIFKTKEGKYGLQTEQSASWIEIVLKGLIP